MVNFISDINNKVDLFLKTKGIISRDGASAGVFISVLLPISILKGEFNLYAHEHDIKLWIPLSFGLLLHSLLNIAYTKRNIPIFNGLSLVPSLLLTFYLTSTSFEEDSGWKTFLNCLLIYIYEYGVLTLMRLLPTAFTYGESCVVNQAVVLFVTSCFTPSNIGTCMGDATVILKVGILCMVGISIVSLLLDLGSKSSLYFIFLVLSIVCAILIPVLYHKIGVNPFLWIFYLTINDYNTILLFSYWLICSFLGVAAVIYQINIKKKASTIVRKSFHVLSLMVYLPSFLVNVCLIYLASGVVFALFVMTDVIRLLEFPVISPALEDGFRIFADEKDLGGISLTPLYLVVGCSFPLWLHPDPSLSNLLPLLSGLITVAIGDTAASVCGSLFGRNKWPGTNKTKEGTIACFISQLFFVIALIHLGYLPRKDLIRPVLAISITSFVEAKTTQVDNLVLPMIMYIIVV